MCDGDFVWSDDDYFGRWGVVVFEYVWCGCWWNVLYVGDLL